MSGVLATTGYRVQGMLSQGLGGKRANFMPNYLCLSIGIFHALGTRNKHGIPLRRLSIFGGYGLPEMRGWVKECLKR